MKSLFKYPRITIAALLVLLVIALARGESLITTMLIVASFAMFAWCWNSSVHLLGARPTLHFILISLVVGWGAEQLGSSYGWFFGSYTYTEVLGPTVGDVPVVIPVMWFALCYVAYVLANLIVWQVPCDGVAGPVQMAVMSFLAAMLVTAYDLGADPYMVFKLDAWIMTKKDGWWFGETLQGFVGWMLVSFVIVFLFRLTLLRHPPQAAWPLGRRHTLVPLIIYGGNMVFQVIDGYPVEIRTIALFAMGIPLFCAACGWVRWLQSSTAPMPAQAQAQAPVRVRVRA